MPSHKNRRCPDPCDISCETFEYCKESLCSPDLNCKDPREICHEKKNAVVAISSQFVFSVPQTEVTQPLLQPLAPNSRADVTISGNGFLIKKPKNKSCKEPQRDRCDPCPEYRNFVVCPASLVLAPPSITSTVFVAPNNNTVPDVLPNGQIQNTYVAPNRVLVGVFGVQDRDCDGCNTIYDNVVYEANIVSVDGIGNVALLEICEDGFNRCLPRLHESHPRLGFANNCTKKVCDVECYAKTKKKYRSKSKKCHKKSKKNCDKKKCDKKPERPLQCGDSVYMLGDFITSEYNRRGQNSYTSIIHGKVADPNFTEHSGWMMTPNILIDAQTYGNPGMPILNCRGLVVGMQTTNIAGIVPQRDINFLTFQTNTIGDGMVAGPTADYITEVIKQTFEHNGCCKTGPGNRLNSVTTDSGASFYTFRRAYLGLAYKLPEITEAYETVDYESGAYAAGQPRITADVNGIISKPACGRSQIAGVKVLGLAGINPDALTGIANGYFYVPGGTAVAPLPTDLPASPLLGKVEPGDIILSVERENGADRITIQLGDADCQIAPERVLQELCPGDRLKLTFRSGNNFPNGAAPNTINCEGEKCLDVNVEELPPLMDYPWYAVNTFPRILYNVANVPQTYPEFITPLATQETQPQVPQLNDGIAVFHPAI